MSVNVREINYEETLNIDKSVFQRENWYLMAWGMGDATAATLFLESRSPVPYKILCQKRVFNGIKFILDNYTPYPHKCLEVLIYPDDFLSQILHVKCQFQHKFGGLYSTFHCLC